MPAALYPLSARKKGKILAATRHQTIRSPKDIAEPLLCGDCETRFNKLGESEVLRWLAPKVLKGAYPLLDAVERAPVIHVTHSLTAASGAVLGIDHEKFAYFALSLVWRAAVHGWMFPDGYRSKRIQIGTHQEALRRYLLQQAEFPQHAVVTVAVCTDQFSRELFVTPTSTQEEGCITVPILVRGVVFRTWLGQSIPQRIRNFCCRSSDGKMIFVTHCKDQTKRLLAGLAPIHPNEPMDYSYLGRLACGCHGECETLQSGRVFMTTSSPCTQHRGRTYAELSAHLVEILNPYPSQVLFPAGS